ncbi:MAG: glycosyltransferase [Paracoccaceae bacterium]
MTGPVLVHETPRPEPSGAEPLGEILLERGAVAEDDLARARAAQPATGARLDEMLIAHGWATEAAVTEGLARQWSMGYADLAADPPDPKAYDPTQLDLLLEYRVVPWRRIGAMVSYAIAEPARAADALDALRPSHGMAFVAAASPRQVDQALTDLAGPQLAERAALRTPSEHSVRSLDVHRKIGIGLFFAALLTAGLAPLTMLTALAAVLLLLSLTTTATRLAAMICSGRDLPVTAPPVDTVRLSERRPLPKISILVPLYDEAGMIPKLVAGLSELDYPRERLDIKLLLEADDQATQDATLDLPPWITTLVVPDGQPRTKPRAMNVALDFCDGDIVGIFDAEDRPDPDQLSRVASFLTNAPPEIACVQCQLSWFNARETWITRCFQIEYGIWFDVLLRGWQWLGLPVPLGGTSVYFRRRVLRNLGGWDAHNVTEDADLGMRLVRHGFRTAVIPSTTEEEANTAMLPWIRQRSRWLKGFMMTWLCHMRAPVRVWREMGPLGFLGLNVLFLGGAITYLAMPLFWVALFMTAFTGQSVFGGALPEGAGLLLGSTLAFGQVVMVACAGLAMRRRGALDLLWVVPTLPIYWTLGAIAAWKAIIEIATAPFYWDKTRHGVSKVSSTLAQDSPNKPETAK